MLNLGLCFGKIKYHVPEKIGLHFRKLIEYSLLNIKNWLSN